jgi:hypothetical protein
MINMPIIRVCKGIFLHSGWEVHSWAIFWAVAIVMWMVIQLVAFFLYTNYELLVQQRLRRLFSRR